MYANGEGVSVNPKTAAKWTRLAAEQGHDRAQSNLGWMYEKGHGVTQDYAKAVKWYRKAAGQGYAKAQSGIAFMYQNGVSVSLLSLADGQTNTSGALGSGVVDD